MQLVKYLGPPQSGSVAAQTASRNTYGQYFRARVQPDETGTPARIAAQTQMSFAVDSWANDLIDVERAAWNAYLIPRTDALGQAQPLQGRQAFVSVFLAQRTFGGTFFRVPPPAPEWQVADVSASSTIGDISLLWSPALSTGDSLTHRLIIYATGVVSAGVTRPPGRSYWQLIASADAGVVQPYDVAAFYSAAKGGLPSAGEIVWLRVREVSNGRFGGEWRSRVVMT